MSGIETAPVRIYVSRLADCPPAHLAFLEHRILSPEERMRAGRLLKPATRAAYTVAHALKRTALEAAIGQAPVLLRDANGKPYVEGRPVEFNLSHTEGFVALAIAQDRPVGIDIEALARQTLPESVLTASLTADERLSVLSSTRPQAAFLAHWTAKEAYVKATGEGLRRNFAELALTRQGGEARLQGPGVLPHRIHCPIGSGYSLCCCVLGSLPEGFALVEIPAAEIGLRGAPPPAGEPISRPRPGHHHFGACP